jgi:hypothetical protein
MRWFRPALAAALDRAATRAGDSAPGQAVRVRRENDRDQVARQDQLQRLLLEPVILDVLQAGLAASYQLAVVWRSALIS